MIAEAMEGLIYRAFEEGWDVDSVIEATAAPIAALSESAAAPRSCWWTLGGPTHDPLTVGFGPNGVLELMFSADAPVEPDADARTGMSDRPLASLRAASRSDVGRVRSANEDSFIERPDMGLWVVADGMGGHANGRWASGTIVDAIAPLAPSGDFDIDIRRVADAIHAANGTIHDRSLADGAQMGSTVAALLVQEGYFSVLWVGDSRVYLYRNGQLHQLSKDHTQVQEMVESGLLTPEEAHTHPMSQSWRERWGLNPASK